MVWQRDKSFYHISYAETDVRKLQSKMINAKQISFFFHSVFLKESFFQDSASNIWFAMLIRFFKVKSAEVYCD